jgi:hypothetical protein
VLPLNSTKRNNAMTKSQIETKSQLESDGWKFLGEHKVEMNRRSYNIVRMIRDGKVAVINSRGGFGGNATVISKTV